jgi:hypothetical protein
MHHPSLPYRDSSLPIEKHLDDLMSRMTLEEKVGQLLMFNGQDMPTTEGKEPSRFQLLVGGSPRRCDLLQATCEFA